MNMWIQDLDKEDISVVGEGCIVNLARMMMKKSKNVKNMEKQ